MLSGISGVVQDEGAIRVPGFPALAGVHAACQVLKREIPGDAALRKPGVALAGFQAEHEVIGQPTGGLRSSRRQRQRRQHQREQD